MGKRENQTIKILFHHIPKTGGTSLIHYLCSLFPKDKVWTTEFLETERQFLRKTLGKKSINYDDYRWEYYFDKFDFIADHFNTIEKAPKDFIVLTFLRDAVARTLSQYKDWRRLTISDIQNNPPVVKEAKMAAKELSVSDFIGLNNPVIRKNFHNLQCKSLLGDARSEREINSYSDEELLEKAKIVMSRVNFVGITENMNASLEKFLALVKLQPTKSLECLNATNENIILSEGDLSQIEYFNKADIALYKSYASSL